MKGSIVSINISDTKGESKNPVEGTVEIRPGWGIVGDVHAGTPGRDVSLLPREALGGVHYGGYGENIDTAGIDILDLAEGTVLTIGNKIRIQITQRGKTCPSRCSIFYQLGNCIMQDKGIFAVVLEGGEVVVGDEITVEDPSSSAEDIAWILQHCKKIAVVGASPKAARPSHWISEFLLSRGYDVTPVRRGVKEILGRPCYPTVRDVPGPIDLVLIFRSEDVPSIVEEAIAKGARAVWMQEGIESSEAFLLAKNAGLKVVMNRCIYKTLKAKEGSE